MSLGRTSLFAILEHEERDHCPEGALHGPEAQRILRESKPLLFVEAHTEEALRRDLELLAPYGYRATGRVFNASPTYELAADESRLPASRDLLEPGLWVSDDPRVTVSFEGKRMRLVSRLEGQSSQVTQLPLNLRRVPASPIPASPSSLYFLQTTGTCSEGLGAAI